MQQLATNVLLNQNLSNTKATANAADKSERPASKNNSSFYELYQRVEAELAQTKKAKAAQHNPSTDKASAPAATNSAVSSVLGQIEMGKKLPSDNGDADDFAQDVAAMMSQLSPEAQQQLLDGLSPEQLTQLQNALANLLNDPSAATIEGLTDIDMTALLQQLSSDNTDGGAVDAKDTDASWEEILAQLLDNKASADEPPSDEDATKEQLMQQILAMLVPAANTAPEAKVSADGGDITNAVSDSQSGASKLSQLLSQLLQSMDPKDDKAAKPSSKEGADQLSQLLASADDVDGNNAELKNLLKNLLGPGDGDNAKLNEATKGDLVKALAALDGTQTTSSKDDSLSTLTQLQQQQQLGKTPAQYQLSLRQGQEPLVQQQNMVQRFAPLMGQQLMTMVKDGIQHAEIRLDPPELGALTVKVQVRAEHTQVQFHVTQTQTRDLLEQAMPRLKEMLQQQGMNLADSHVSYGNGNSGNGAEQQGDSAGSSGHGGTHAASGDETSSEDVSYSINRSNSLLSGIDYYA